MTGADIVHLVGLSAGYVSLDPLLVAAIVQIESGGNPWAWNPEPRYRYLWDVKQGQPFRALTAAESASEAPPADFPTLAGDRDQEFWGQQASWGLMQVMGAVAREERFDEPYLPALCDPKTGLLWGCTHLRSLMRWAQGDIGKAVGAYNAGRGGWDSPAGRAYAAKVLGAIRKG